MIEMRTQNLWNEIEHGSARLLMPPAVTHPFSDRLSDRAEAALLRTTNRLI